MVNYCLPIIEESAAETISCIEDNLSQYSYFEVWLDYIENFSHQLIPQLIEKYGEKLIFLFRRRNLENTILSQQVRNEILKLLGGKSCLLDLDISQQAEEIKFLQANKLSIRTILSYHNYQETPSEEKLKEIIKEMQASNPEIYKISCLCKSKKDALRLLELLLELKEAGKKCVILGMGEDSSITRIFGTLWGNELIFAPVSLDQASAAGQLTKKQLEAIYSQLKLN